MYFQPILNMPASVLKSPYIGTETDVTFEAEATRDGKSQSAEGSEFKCLVYTKK